uniref:Structural maintenance of chromosomes 6 n=1 Tax=Syphacia muris TaxID=451379 RepID=A0A0N5ACR2_9BILA
LKNRIREIVANRDSLQKQLGTPLLSQLSTEEQELLNSLQVEQQKDLEGQVAEFSKQADVICTKQSVMQAKREDSMKKIRELGSLPMDAKNYESYSLKQLDKKLNEALEQLKKYENVNKRALDQYVQASSQKEELTRRMEEHKAINDLVNVLDHRKYEAIQLTFKQVSKNFKTVFQKLVPDGSGCLIMRTGGNSTENTDIPIVETFTGIGIEVCRTFIII